jgi:uncharacterized protein YecE (DUF72 family)
MGERIGTAGWSIARKDADGFPAEGTALERYSRVFSSLEVNPSFHRAHRPSTWAKWAESVPEQFRFAVKIPNTITHQAKPLDIDTLVAPFAEQVRQLGGKLAVLLVQLPHRLAFDAELAKRFFETLRNTINTEIACEPREASWFEGDADAMLRKPRVAADPAFATRRVRRKDGRVCPTGGSMDRRRCTAPRTVTKLSTCTPRKFRRRSTTASNHGACSTIRRLRKLRATRCR